MTWPVILMLAATSFDVGTTTYKMGQGCVEANPLLVKTHINTPVRIAVYEEGVSVGLVWTFGKAGKTHPKVVKATALTLAGSHAIAGVWNLTRQCR